MAMERLGDITNRIVGRMVVDGDAGAATPAVSREKRAPTEAGAKVTEPHQSGGRELDGASNLLKLVHDARSTIF